MKYDDVWYATEQEISATIKAYYQKTSYEAWLNGLYNMRAFHVVIANSFGTKEVEYFTEPMGVLEQKDLDEIRSVKKETESEKMLRIHNSWY